MRRRLIRARAALFLLWLGALVAPADPARAEPPAAQPAWSDVQPGLPAGVRARQALVVHVLVPLCDNDQIACGSALAGDPDDLAHNLYWGAIFGQKRFFSRKSSAYSAVAEQPGKGPLLQRAVFKKRAAGKPWDSEDDPEIFVVLDAFRGDAIDEVVDRFFDEAERGGSVTFEEDGKPRTMTVDVVGYAGHNRMMDGKLAPALKSKDPKGIPSFVMACHSASYFAAPLAARHSATLLMTRALMAPEGYVIEAIATALGDNVSKRELRRRVVGAYAKWQKVEAKVASTIFEKI